MDFRSAVLFQSLNGTRFASGELKRLFESEVKAGDLESVQRACDRQVDGGWLDFEHKMQEVAEKQGFRWVLWGDEDYPANWQDLRWPPAVFALQGPAVWTSHRTISIVGSRAPMRETYLWMQRELSAYLRRTMVAVVSGGARGVDSWAHRLAMDAARPTVCILPSGILNPYPPGIENLLADIIAKGGSIVSTFSPHQRMQRFLFEIRNRWIAALSQTTFVVEANRKSGSLMTGRLAFEEGRSVCALPVFPDCQNGQGNLDLLAKEGIMIRDFRDLLVVPL